MPRARVLIVDDNQADATTLRRYLDNDSAGDYAINSVMSGEAGLDMAAGFNPDVILLDYELPDMDGLEFLRELPDRMGNRSTPPVVVAVTGQREPRIAAELIRGGADEYMCKDETSPESVRLAVRQGVRTRALRAALAERARERERSNQALVESLQRAAYVASFSEALSKSLSSSAVLKTVGELAVPSLADVCFVDVVEGERLERAIVVANAAFKPLEKRTDALPVSIDGFEGAPKVIRTGLGAKYARSWLSALARWDADIARALELGSLENAIVVPMIFDGESIGAITLLSLRKLDGYAQEVAGELARRAAAALTNARVFEAERAAKRASDEARRRLAFLSAISEVFSRSLEWRETMQEIIRLIVPGVADYAAISILEHGELKLVASSGESQHVRGETDPQRTLLRQPEYYPDLDLLRRFNDSGRTLHSVDQRSGEGSFIRVPIVVPSGAALGELLLATRDERRLSLDDLALSEDIARRIGLYVQTAQTFERERNIARSLQQSLLPLDVPPLPGVQIAARCLAGAAGVEVGGDWYDIIPLQDGFVAFVVGDVAGRGVRAAAVMGQLRSSLRAYVIEGCGPAQALERLNAFMLSQEEMDFATVALGILHCASGTLRLASAGHLPPLFWNPNAEVLAIPSSVPVGVAPEQRYEESVISLAQGDALALFTDGLVESRGQSIEVGTQRLMEAVTLEDGPEEAVAQALRLLPAEPDDDVTVLVLRYTGIGAELRAEPCPKLFLTFRAQPESAGRVRAALDEFFERAEVAADMRFDLQLAVGEAVANAVEHAYKDGASAVFSVSAEIVDEMLTIDVLDQGRWRDGVRTPRGELSERGRGVALMRALCDGVRIDRTLFGTRIKLRVAVSRAIERNQYA